MGFYFIYVDEYGNSGTRLDDPEQPLFLLQAAFIKADETWIQIEKAYVNLLEEISGSLKVDENIRLHMVDMYQRKGVFRKATIEQVFEWIETVLKIAYDNNVLYLPVAPPANTFLMPFETEDVKRAFEAKHTRDSKGHLHARVPQYRMTFPLLLSNVDAVLEHLDAYGIIIVDQNQGYDKYENLSLYRAMRAKGLLNRIIENPVYRDSRHNTLLAVPDFSGYLTAGTIVDAWFKQKRRPKLVEWEARYIRPRSLPFTLDPIFVEKKLLIYGSKSYSLTAFMFEQLMDRNLEVVTSRVSDLGRSMEIAEIYKILMAADDLGLLDE